MLRESLAGIPGAISSIVELVHWFISQWTMVNGEKNVISKGLIWLSFFSFINFDIFVALIKERFIRATHRSFLKRLEILMNYLHR